MSTAAATQLTQEDLHGSPLAGHEAELDGLRSAGAEFHARGWSLGTSSNYSVVVNRLPLELIVTASGKDKSRLTRHDFVRVGADGRPTAPDQPRSSAETLLHLVAAEQPAVSAVLHTHSVWGTVLSEHFAAAGAVLLEGYEMLKGLSANSTHACSERVPIFENTQDIPQLARQVRDQLFHTESPIQHGYLIRRHGLYTWGRDLAEARRHIEIFEFLFECVGRQLGLKHAD